MKDGKTIAVVVPCYNEEAKIAGVITTVPAFVDHIIVIDDASTDNTAGVVESHMAAEPRLRLITHEKNAGKGAGTVTGYRHCIEEGYDIAVIIDGDGQMHPDDMAGLVQPLIDGRADYVKGNRFFTELGLKDFPKHRLFGNLVLSALTKIASGYWHVSDTQCGYTAINRAALLAVDWDDTYPRYGCPNDYLTRLNISNMRVAEVPVRPIYGPEWGSKMRVRKVVGPMLALLFGLVKMRLFKKYVFMNGHPLVFYVLFGVIFLMLALVFVVRVVWVLIAAGNAPIVSLVLGGLFFVSGLQFLLSAFALDHQENEHLAVRLR